MACPFDIYSGRPQFRLRAMMFDTFDLVETLH